jgi:hypothetical protein
MYDACAYPRFQDNQHGEGIYSQQYSYIPWIQALIPNGPTFIEALNRRIQRYQSLIQECGRAVSDMHLAYKDHATKYDVPIPQYDAKEFNLRANIITPMDVSIGQDKNVVILDSRLDQSAALQAVTSSTSRLHTLWEESAGQYMESVGDYLEEAGVFDEEIDGEKYHVPHIFHEDTDIYAPEYADNVYAPFVISNVMFLVLDTNETNTYADINNTYPLYIPEIKAVNASEAGYWCLWTQKNSWNFISSFALRYHPAIFKNAQDQASVGIAHENINAYSNARSVMNNIVQFNNISAPEQSRRDLVFYTGIDDMRVDIRTRHIWNKIEGSLIAAQMHNHTIKDVVYDAGDAKKLYINDMNTLSYDTAIISNKQLAQIQNFFLRNLTRGDYTCKSSEDMKEVKQDVEQLADNVINKEPIKVDLK